MNHQLIHIGRRNAVALLAYLAATQRRHSRAHLAALLWPAYDEAGARSELRRALSTLNRALGAQWVDADRNNVVLSGAPGLQVDILIFRDHMAAARAANTDPQTPLRAAVELAQADFMSGFALDDAPDFEEWQRFEAGALRRELAWALEQLSQPAAHQDAAQALAHAARWLALDPLDEAAHRRLMELHAAAGDLSAAYRQYQECKQRLAQELDAPPAPETTALYEQIRTGDFPTSSGTASEIHEAPQSPNHPITQSPLPAHLTPFIGRAHELGEIAALLNSGDHRLITITGPGGIGKTRLALQMAHQQTAADRWRDGVHFVDLTAVEDGELLISTLAKGLEVNLAGGQPLLAQLIEYLNNKQMLIVFDNVEQLLTAANASTLAQLFDELLLHANAVAALVTSRERLNLHGETVFNLLGMPFPATVDHTASGRESGPDPALDAYDAIRLFRQSAQRADRAFALTAENQAAVLQICQLVQGMPLAIDLAAAWVRMLTCAEIAAEIGQSIEFLVATAHNLPARHRSIAAVFNHSWQLLSPPEQSAFARLSLFRGGCTREAAQRVTGATLPILSMLVDKSLLRRTGAGRFVIHELLRQFGAEKLAAQPAIQQQTRTEHAHFFTTLIEQCDSDLKSGHDARAIQQIRADFENLHAAWQWMLEHEELPLIARFCPGWERYFQQAGEFAHGHVLFAEAVHRLAHHPLESEALVWIHCAHGSLSVRTGDNTRAAQILERCVDAARRLQHVPLQALALYRAGVNSEYQGKYDEARAQLAEAIHLGQQLDDPFLLGSMFNSLAIVEWMQDELDLAEEHALRGLALAQSINNEISIAMRLATVASIAFAKKEYHRSIEYGEQAYAKFVARKHVWGIGSSLHNLASAWGALGDHEKALAMKLEAAGYEEETGHQWDLAVNHCSIAGTLVELGRLEEAETRAQTGISLAGSEMAQISVFGLGILGKVEAKRGNLSTAVALLTFAINHSAMAGYLANELIPTLDDLRTEIQPAQLAEAEQQAAQWTLEELLLLQDLC
ncbi:MAG: BTAD domain-containing putative transcriptional regulator [Caldilineaceae bacterium]